MDILILALAMSFGLMVMLGLASLVFSIYLFVDGKRFLGAIVLGIAGYLGYVSISSLMILYPYLR